VLPVQSPTALQPDQSVAISPSERDRISTLATTFATDYPTLPVTLAPNPETLDALDRGSPDDRATLETLKQAARGRGVLATTFVPIDDEAWRSNSMGAELTGQFNNGVNTITRSLGSTQTALVSDVALSDRSDTTDTLGLRRAFGANRVVVDEGGLEPLNEQRFPSTVLQSFVLNDTAGNELRGMAADRRLGALARSLSDPALATRRPLLVQQFIADLVAGYYDNPLIARGTVIVLPDNWAINSAIHDLLLPTLSTAPMLRLVGLDALFETVSKGSPAGRSASETLSSGPLRRTLKPEPARALTDYPAQLARIAAKLSAYEAMLGTATSARSSDLHDLLAVTGDDRLDTPNRRAYLNTVDDAITRRLRTADGRAGIVAPGKQRITMTSRRTEIPLQLENQLSYPVTVRLELRSEKLDFPNGWIATETLQPGANTVNLVVRSRTSGDSLLEVSVLAPGADPSIGALATTKFTVRSTALSGVGLALSIVALLVLLTWWIRHARRTRRARRAAETVIDLGTRTSEEQDAVTTTLHESLGTGTER